MRLIASGAIAGAALDVFEQEPAVNPEAEVKLAQSGKVVLLPHAWARPRSRAGSTWARR